MSQKDGRWGNEQIGYYNKDTISEGGCFLTCIAMSADFAGLWPKTVIGVPLWDNFVVSPPYIDYAIKQNHGYFDDGQYGMTFDWEHALRGMFFKGGYVGLGLEKGNSMLDVYYRLEAIDEGYQVPLPIIGVHFTDDYGQKQHHALLIVGYVDKTYFYYDPANSPVSIYGISNLGNLTDYKLNKKNCEVDSYIIPNIVPQPSDSILLGAFSPIQLLAIDPQGRKTGVDSKGFEINDIPNSQYNIQPTFGVESPLIPYDPPKILQITNPIEGLYRLQLIGTGDGPFKLIFRRFNGASAENVITGNIQEGQVLKYEINYQKTGSLNIAQVPNFTPFVNAGNDFNGITGKQITFDASNSYDTDGSIISYSWDFGDGTKMGGKQVTHAYTLPGIYNVKLTVEDNGGSTASTTVQASIILAQRKPVADISGPYVGYADSPERRNRMSFEAMKSYDPNNDALTYKWDFGDGTPIETTLGPYAYHYYYLPGLYTATLIANDGTDNSDPSTTTVEIFPALRPTAFSVWPESVVAGSQITISGNVSETSLMRGCYDLKYQQIVPVPFSVGIEEVGENEPTHGDSLSFFLPLETRSFEQTFIVPEDWPPGEYKILAIEGIKVASFTVLAEPPKNYLPLADAGGPYTGKVGALVSFDGSLSSDPNGLPLSYYWDFGDGTTGQGEFPTHAYASPGTYYPALIVGSINGFSILTVGTKARTSATIESSAVETSYTATIQALIEGTETELQVPVSMDGNPTGFNTPHTFTELSGQHDFTVATAGPDGNLFVQWSVGTSNPMLSINSEGTYTAYYAGASIHPVPEAPYGTLLTLLSMTLALFGFSGVRAKLRRHH